MNEDVLYAGLRFLRVVGGTVHVTCNADLTSLAFLRSVVRLGGLTVIQDPALVDGRVPAVTPRISVAVSGTPMLCPERLPGYASSYFVFPQTCSNAYVVLAVQSPTRPDGIANGIVDFLRNATVSSV